MPALEKSMSRCSIGFSALRFLGNAELLASGLRSMRIGPPFNLCFSQFWLQILLFRHFTYLICLIVQGLDFPDQLSRLHRVFSLLFHFPLVFWLPRFLDTRHPAMASNDETGTVSPPQPLLGSLRPICTVKRFANRAVRAAPYVASEPAPFCPPTPKAPSIPLPQLVCRWSQGRFAPDYRPRGFSLHGSAGLSPQQREPRSHFFGVLPVGGLACCPSPLGIHRPGIQPLLPRDLRRCHCPHFIRR